MTASDGGWAIMWARADRFDYTLGPALRIADIKNMGKDLAPEELRICPEFAGGPARPAIFFDFRGAKTRKSLKKSRAARAKDDHLDHR